MLLEQVAVDQAAAEKVKETVSLEAKDVEAFQVKVQGIADDAKADLEEAMPILESAVKSLSALNKGDIVEIKSFSKPPALVQLTMEAVCTLKQEKPDWDTAKKVLTDSTFMESLKGFDKENIPDAVIKKLKKCVLGIRRRSFGIDKCDLCLTNPTVHVLHLRKGCNVLPSKARGNRCLKQYSAASTCYRYIENPDFQPDTVGRQSKAAMSLCLWVRAMDRFHIVNKVVEPKKAMLRNAESQLAEANAKLKQKTDSLKVCTT